MRGTVDGAEVHMGAVLQVDTGPTASNMGYGLWVTDPGEAAVAVS